MLTNNRSLQSLGNVIIWYQLSLCVDFFFPPQPSAFEEKAIEKVDDLLESYMGIRDSELGKFVMALRVSWFVHVIFWFVFTK